MLICLLILLLVIGIVGQIVLAAQVLSPPDIALRRVSCTICLMLRCVLVVCLLRCFAFAVLCALFYAILVTCCCAVLCISSSVFRI